MSLLVVIHFMSLDRLSRKDRENEGHQVLDHDSVPIGLISPGKSCQGQGHVYSYEASVVVLVQRGYTVYDAIVSPDLRPLPS